MANESISNSSPREIALKGAIALAQDPKTHPQANEQFEQLCASLESENAEIAGLLKQLWQEYVSLQRSASFWEGMSDAEKELSEKMAEKNIQLKQNYLRLMQEQ
ncbi:hypothetical protein IQ241_20685 [Romeria aff. gracilis LEGE 07310]|uniref:Uncharacterized protein n=1 Tax=Vasconcelosia minhoensis LEGE 07310 TaxID=915328 RepID=A0A8J7AIP0_9CYAN|nr:hypothetical protein [Romeria gracilis]MBE9079679.1 hypothetical protein [Romeria aff. gracilis LEGE 07310]